MGGTGDPIPQIFLYTSVNFLPFPVPPAQQIVSMEICHVTDDHDHVTSLIVTAHADGRLAIISGLDEVYAIHANLGVIVQIRCCERSANHTESFCDFATCNSEGTLTLWKFLWQDGAPSFEAVQDLYLSDNGKVKEFTVMKNTVLASHGR